MLSGGPLWSLLSACRNGQDGDDGDPSVYPSAEEVCDEVDQDGDDLVDEVTTRLWVR